MESRGAVGGGVEFEEFKEILRGRTLPERAMLAEFLVDEEIRAHITRTRLDEQYVPAPVAMMHAQKGMPVRYVGNEESYLRYYDQVLRFFCHMGYPVYPDLGFVFAFESLNTLAVRSADTAVLPKENRFWATQHVGMVHSWESLEQFPWRTADTLIDEYAAIYSAVLGLLPRGMKVAVVTTVFEEVLEWVVGYETLFYLLYDDPRLVGEVFSRVGDLMYRFCEATIGLEAVGCVWHGDDLAYKSNTMVSRQVLESYVFPWFEKISRLAHDNDKLFLLHCCGNKEPIMEYLVEKVQIDAIHSFEDASSPVADYKRRWGKSVGIIGGLDVDKLSRLDEKQLRNYTRGTLDACMAGGRYVCGSGNSFCNYIPVENYLIVMDEVGKWRR